MAARTIQRPRAGVKARVARSHDSGTARLVLAILRRARQPLSAYDLLHGLEATAARKIAPPTVYRALDALLGQGLIARIESRSAYVVRAHVGHVEDCVFFVCDRCHASQEIEDRSLQVLISEQARALGFQVTHRVVEMAGLCGRCQGTESFPKAS